MLTLAALCGAMPSALGQGDRTTASQVDLMNLETLKKFVESARDYISSITDINQLAALAVELRDEGGDWKDGNMYLVILTPDGTVWFHGADVALDGTDVSDVTDDDGAEVVQKILAAGQMQGGGFVDYTWDDPSDPDDTFHKVCFALGYTSELAQTDFILVAGYYQDLSAVETDIGGLPDPPALNAAHVVDRETLKAFVQGAVAWTFESVAEHDLGLVKLTEEFRREGGPWRQGATYLFVMTEQGYVLFHGSRPDQQGHIQVERQDRNGFKFVKALIDAATSGGGYVEYYWDDPSVMGDEDLGSAKVGYAETIACRTTAPSTQAKPSSSAPDSTRDTRWPWTLPISPMADPSAPTWVGEPGRDADPASGLFLRKERRTHRSGIDGGRHGQPVPHPLRGSDPHRRVAGPGRDHYFDQRHGRTHDRIGQGGHRRPRQPHRRRASL